MVAVDSESVDTSDLRSLADVTSRFGVSVLLGGTVSVDDQQRSVGAFFVFVDQRLLPDAPELAGVVRLDTVRVDDNVRAGGHALRTMSSYLSTGHPSDSRLDCCRGPASVEAVRPCWRTHRSSRGSCEGGRGARQDVARAPRSTPDSSRALTAISHEPPGVVHQTTLTRPRASSVKLTIEAISRDVGGSGSPKSRLPPSRRGRLCRPIAMARLPRNRATILCATRRLRACPTPKQR